MGLPPKNGPLKAVTGEVSLERTPGKLLLATYFYLRNLSLRAEPEEKVRVNPLKRCPCLSRLRQRRSNHPTMETGESKRLKEAKTKGEPRPSEAGDRGNS